MGKSEPLIRVENLKKYFPIRRNLFRAGRYAGGMYIKALDGISFSIDKKQSLGIAGESGCGKSTTGMILLNLLEPTEGRYYLKGKDVTYLNKEDILPFRKSAQLMFQNPFEALNPRFTIFRSLVEPLIIHKVGTKEEKRAMVEQMLAKVNLLPVETYIDKYPHELSGGQLQRVVLARALIINPEFLIADEPVSMLDVSIRAGVLNLMKRITEEMELTTIYISHDLSLIEYMCDRTIIMYLGNIVEEGRTATLLSQPAHPYTKALIAAAPSPDPTEVGEPPRIKNSVPDPINTPKGCIFLDRCPFALGICSEEKPKMREITEGHKTACHLNN